MLVPGLANVSIASIRAALQRVAIPALSAEAHMRHLEAAGALIQQLCQAETTQVGFDCCCVQLQYSAEAAMPSLLHCLEHIMLGSHDYRVLSACTLCFHSIGHETCL